MSLLCATQEQLLSRDYRRTLPQKAAHRQVQGAAMGKEALGSSRLSSSRHWPKTANRPPALWQLCS